MIPSTERGPGGPPVECRACGGTVATAVDLGPQPAIGTFPPVGDPRAELRPLRIGICASCSLAQLAVPGSPDFDDPEAPSPLASATMAEHGRLLVADLERRGLVSPASRIVTVASHGGHLGPLLRERGFASTALDGSAVRVRRLRAAGEKVLAWSPAGRDPVPAAASAASDLVVDLYLMNHVQHPRVALRRLVSLVAPRGTLVIEYDDLAANVREGIWDSIGSGHPVYPTLTWLAPELEGLGLQIVDAVERHVYGGAMQIIARAGEPRGSSVAALLEREAAAGLSRPEGLAPLADAAERARRDVVPYLRAARDAGRTVVGYGAPARSITFLNALEIGPDLLPYVVDRAAAKHGRAIPGVQIPILRPDTLVSDQPDEVLILAWNLASEVVEALSPVLPRTRFLVAIPEFAEVTGAGHVRVDRPPGDGMR